MSSEDIQFDIDLPWDDFLDNSVLLYMSKMHSVSLRASAFKCLAAKVRDTEMKELSQALVERIIGILMRTLPLYDDHRSCRAVLSVIKEFVIKTRHPEKKLEYAFIKLFNKIVEKELKSSLYRMERFLIHRFISWTSFILNLIVSEAKSLPQVELSSSTSFKDCLVLHSVALDAMSQVPTPSFASSKSFTRAKSLTVDIFLNNRTVFPALLQHILNSLTEGAPSSSIAVLLGSCLDFAMQQKIQLNSADQENIIKFYVKTILSSKTTVPDSHLIAFHNFFGEYMTEKIFVDSILSVGERMLLRSPEVILKVFDYLFRSVRFDASTYFKSKLADVVFNQLKSANESVRLDAMNLFKSLSTKSTNGSDVAEVIDVFAKAITGKSPSVDQRVLYYTALSFLPTNAQVSSKFLQLLPGLAVKEATDTVYNACLTVITSHLTYYLSKENDQNRDSAFVKQTILPLLIKGVSDKKSFYRKGYMHGLWSSCKSDHALNLLGVNGVEQLVVLALDVLEKVQAAGISVIDPKKETPLLVEGYYGLHWLLLVLEWAKSLGPAGQNIVDLLEKKKLVQQFLGLPSTKSFVLSEKLFGKLSAEDEQEPFVHLIVYLLSVTEHYELVASVDVLAFASAVMYCTIQSSLHVTRHKACKFLEELVQQSSELVRRVCGIVIIGLNNIKIPETAPVAVEDRLTWAIGPIQCSSDYGTRLYSLIQTITPSSKMLQEHPTIDRLVVEECVTDFVMLTSDSRITSIFGNDAWIRLCFRAGLDPRAVVEKYTPILFSKWFAKKAVGEEWEYDLSESGISESILSVISLFSSVAPRLVISELFDWIKTVLHANMVSSITQLDIDVWKTPEGELNTDPIKQLQKGQAPRAKASSAIAGAKSGGAGGSSSKPSKAEKELINQQLEKESAIRSRVQRVYNTVSSGLRILKSVLEGLRVSLADDARSAIQNYMGQFVNQVLLNVIVRECVKIPESPSIVMFRPLAIDVFVTLGRIAGYRLESLIVPRPVLAMNVLRLVGAPEGSDGVPKMYCNASVAVSAESLLLSIKSLYTMSEPLSPESFSYLMPLFYCLVIKDARYAKISEKQSIELSMTVAEILLAHSSIGSHYGIPKGNYAKCLISLMASFARLHKNAREGMNIFCAAVGSVQEDPESTASDGDYSIQERAECESLVSVLLDGLLYNEEVVREACLQSLQVLQVPSGLKPPFDVRVWIAKHDESDNILAEAEKLWEDINGEKGVPKSCIEDLTELAVYGVPSVRESAGKALCTAFKLYPEEIGSSLNKIYKIYAEKAAPIVPEYDEFGMVIPSSIDKVDDWEGRVGIATTLKACAGVITDPTGLFSFFIDYEALGDRDEKVRRKMLEAALASINVHGKTHVKELIKAFDAYLSLPDKPSSTHDRIRENVVILLGNLAQHLDPTKSTIPDVISKLVDTLKTPSEPVQMAVSDCLPALIKLVPNTAEGLIEKLLREVFNGEKYAARRGAAYGLAGVVKGKGISSLKEFSIMIKLKEAVEDKKNAQKREGVLCCYETLSYSLGRLFEPYVIQILPLLLACYGDAVKEVREATDDACRVIMSKLSGHCVKLVMPSLLQGLETDNWRTKMGSVEVLGSMAFLAPKQLSLSLPQVVPRLTEALADSHSRVQNAAQTALNNFGQVIKNPEIQLLVPTLIQALVDPNSKTNNALVSLLETSFVHYIDAPSLALVVPILQRGLKERSTDVKKRSAQIMGNMASLTDQKDLTPYLLTLMPGLKDVLIDPVPEARATAAKALGLMVERLGEDSFPGLVAELLATLKSDTSSVDRSGASQGLSEIIAGLGTQRLEGLLPEIVINMNSNKGYIREGFMTLLVYLPATYGEKFQPYLGQIIPPILKGLADEYEAVRDSALKAAQMIVRNYATKAIDLLLPELEIGLFDENWRIRQSSLQLMGDLLYRISGVSGKKDVAENENEEDDSAVGYTETSKKALINALGLERTHSVLSSVYIIRSDSNGIVRQASIHVWKSIVSNTPRTLKEILPIMMNQLITSLASDSLDKRGVAARTLGELVRKLGESILVEIVPLLEKGLQSENPDTRQGVCVGMSEIMIAAGKQQVQDFTLQCIPSIRKALIDEEPEVREAAAQAFDELHQHLGARAIDEVLPSLLNALKQGEPGASGNRNFALEALKEIMSVRANAVFPVLIPNLITTPITVFNARALGSLIAVAGQALNKRLGVVFPALVDALEQNDDAVEVIRESLKTLVLSVTEDGIHLLMGILMEFVSEGSVHRRKTACECLAILYSQPKPKVTTYLSDWITRMLALFKQSESAKVDLDTVKAAWAALDAVTKSIKKDDMDKYVSTCRKAIASVTEKLEENDTLDGFNIPKGISPILPIFLQGLMYGGSDNRTQSALGLGDLVQRTSPDALRLFVTQITGPLIRVIGDRFPSTVKSAILQTLESLFVKVPNLLKPFLPQLQRTFIKSLSEPFSTVRDRAAGCLSLLITMQTRLDPIVTELGQGIKSGEDKGIKEAMWTAMYGLVKGFIKGPEINSASKKMIEELSLDVLVNGGENDDYLRSLASRVFGLYCTHVPISESKQLFSSLIKDVGAETPWTRLHGIVLSILSIYSESSSLLNEMDMSADVLRIITGAAVQHEKTQIVEASILTIGKILIVDDSLTEATRLQLVGILAGAVLPAQDAEVRRNAIVIIKNISKNKYELMGKHITLIIPNLMQCIRDRVIPVKLASERAMLHLLQIGKDETVLQNYLKSVDGSTNRSVGEFAKRVLSKLADDETE